MKKIKKVTGWTWRSVHLCGWPRVRSQHCGKAIRLDNSAIPVMYTKRALQICWVHQQTNILLQKETEGKRKRATHSWYQCQSHQQRVLPRHHEHQGGLPCFWKWAKLVQTQGPGERGGRWTSSWWLLSEDVSCNWFRNLGLDCLISCIFCNQLLYCWYATQTSSTNYCVYAMSRCNKCS